MRWEINALDKEKAARVPSQTMIKAYQSGIDQANNRLDSLRGTTPPEAVKYVARNGDDILAVIVRCTYSANEPLTDKRVTETFDFFFPPDGTKCYAQKGIGE